MSSSAECAPRAPSAAGSAASRSSSHEPFERADEEDHVHLFPVRGGARREGGCLVDALGLAAVGVYDELGHVDLNLFGEETGEGQHQ